MHSPKYAHSILNSMTCTQILAVSCYEAYVGNNMQVSALHSFLVLQVSNTDAENPDQEVVVRSYSYSILSGRGTNLMMTTRQLT